jgi:hypothetical protein
MASSTGKFVITKSTFLLLLFLSSLGFFFTAAHSHPSLHHNLALALVLCSVGISLLGICSLITNSNSRTTYQREHFRYTAADCPNKGMRPVFGNFDWTDGFIAYITPISPEAYYFFCNDCGFSKGYSKVKGVTPRLGQTLTIAKSHP